MGFQWIRSMSIGWLFDSANRLWFEVDRWENCYFSYLMKGRAALPANAIEWRQLFEWPMANERTMQTYWDQFLWLRLVMKAIIITLRTVDTHSSVVGSIDCQLRLASSTSIQFEINPIQSNYLIPFICCANIGRIERATLATRSAASARTSLPFSPRTSHILAIGLWEMSESDSIANTTVEFIKWNDSKIIFLVVVGRWTGCWLAGYSVWPKIYWQPLNQGNHLKSILAIDVSHAIQFDSMFGGSLSLLDLDGGGGGHCQLKPIGHIIRICWLNISRKRDSVQRDQRVTSWWREERRSGCVNVSMLSTEEFNEISVTIGWIESRMKVCGGECWQVSNSFFVPPGRLCEVNGIVFVCL